MTTPGSLRLSPRDDIEAARAAVSLVTAAADGRDAFNKVAPALLDGLVTSDDPIESALMYLGVAWWVCHHARLCGQEMDRLAGVGYFDEALRRAGQHLASLPTEGDS